MKQIIVLSVLLLGRSAFADMEFPTAAQIASCIPEKKSENRVEIYQSLESEGSGFIVLGGKALKKIILKVSLQTSPSVRAVVQDALLRGAQISLSGKSGRVRGVLSAGNKTVDELDCIAQVQ